MKTSRQREAPAHFDQQALAEIYDTYHLPIYRSIYRRVGDIETARDLAADVFQRLLHALQKGGGPSRDVQAWLYRAANNIVVDHYRRRRFRDHESLDQEPPAQTADPAQTAENNILAAAARRALNSLTDDQRQVITLKFLDGLSNQETAAILGKSPGAVKSLQHRALAALQRQLPAEAAELPGVRSSPPPPGEEKGTAPSGTIPNNNQQLTTIS